MAMLEPGCFLGEMHTAHSPTPASPTPTMDTPHASFTSPTSPFSRAKRRNAAARRHGRRPIILHRQKGGFRPGVYAFRAAGVWFTVVSSGQWFAAYALPGLKDDSSPRLTVQRDLVRGFPLFSWGNDGGPGKEQQALRYPAQPRVATGSDTTRELHYIPCVRSLEATWTLFLWSHKHARPLKNTRPSLAVDPSLHPCGLPRRALRDFKVAKHVYIDHVSIFNR